MKLRGNPIFDFFVERFAYSQALRFASDTRNETMFIKTNDPRCDKKMSRRGSKGRGRVFWQYFERTSAIRLLIHSLETRCFRRVRQWVVARFASDSHFPSSSPFKWKPFTQIVNFQHLLRLLFKFFAKIYFSKFLIPHNNI